MATAWPFTGVPRVWDLDEKIQDTELTRTAVASATKHILGGLAVSNPTIYDAVVIFTDDFGHEVWRFTLKGGESDDKEWNLRPIDGLWRQASVAGIHTHAWGWSGT